MCYSKIRSKNLGEKKKIKKISSGTAFDEEIPQEEQQPGPLRQCNNLVESLNDESIDEKEDDRTTFKFCKIPLDRTN